MNQATFHRVSIGGAVGGPPWERYFAYCPTVQNIRDVIKQEGGGWSSVWSGLLDCLKGSTNGTFDITIKVAETVVGYVTVQKLEMYNEMRYKIIDESVSGHCCFEASVVDTETPLGRTICECFKRADAEKIAAALEDKKC